MKTKAPASFEEFQARVADLWPLLKGSVAEVFKPCIRAGCEACASGKKHPAFIYSFTENGKRKCMYVPKELVPIFRKGLDNGRLLESWTYAWGRSLLEEHRKNRDKPAPSRAKSKIKARK